MIMWERDRGREGEEEEKERVGEKKERESEEEKGYQARTQDFLKGGVKRTFTSTPPPLDIACVTSSTLRKMDIACVPSSTLHKIDKHPRLDIHKHPPPPLGHCPCDVINIPRGVIGPGHAHFAYVFSIRTSSEG